VDLIKRDFNKNKTITFVSSINAIKNIENFLVNNYGEEKTGYNNIFYLQFSVNNLLCYISLTSATNYHVKVVAQIPLDKTLHDVSAFPEKEWKLFIK
jgi:hypothetical protein